jgi:ATP-binding cassette subfamily F protein uup
VCVEVSKPKETDSKARSNEQKTKKKLSYNEVRELESLPKKIETLETEIDSLQTEVNDPEFFKQDSELTTTKLNQLAELESNLEIAYARWEELEEKQ